VKLYSLSLRAIGPFAGEHHVDFEALGRSGLFLLEGPTGAGKSTIIDAIVFALYGQLAGSGSSKQRLYSHHAAAGVEPFVDLIFEVESGLYRVRRTPSFERPKKRGAGTRTVNESVVLTRLTDVDRPDEGVTVSTRAQEAGDEITRMLGLRRDQFLQTVVLPQGEFATFLQASGEERKKLLQTIFRTDLYERITQELIDRRKAAAARTETARTAVASASSVLRRVADLSDDEPFDPRAVLHEATEAERTRSAQVDEARLARDLAEQDLRAAESLHGAIARHAALRRRAQVHAERQAEVDRVAEQVTTARRALQVLPCVRAERSAALALERADEDQRAALAQAPDDVDTASLDRAAGDRYVDDVSARLERITELMVVERDLEVRAGERAALVREHDELVRRADEVDSRRAARPLRRAELTEQAQSVAEQLAERGVLETAVATAQQRLEAARAVAELTVKVERSRELVKSLAGDATTAEHVRAELQLARIRGIAGELAEQLVVGEACVVCGSDSHPRPAARSVDHPEAEAVERAETRVQQVTAALTEARAALDVDNQQIAFWRGQCGDTTIEQAKAAHLAAVERVDRLSDLADQEHQIRSELQALDAEAAADDQLRRDLAERAAALAERLAALDAAIATDRERVEQARTDGVSLAEVAADLERRREAVRRISAALVATAHARERLDQARTALVEALTVHEFSSADDVTSAALQPVELEGLQGVVDAHLAEAAKIAEGLAEPDVAALTGDEDPPDLDDVRARRTAAVDALEAAVGLHNVARRRLEQITQALDSLRKAEQALDDADVDARAVTRLAGLADGTSPQNLKRLTLGTYVLLRRFADVVDAANARLAPMSDGRYQLQVSDRRERSAAGRRTGLALSVIDAETGREREPRTLSGGETFYVSLCLALGLADVVTAESGGVHLGTLFVDEGFGALDAETLDGVMNQISTLARGGRTVGLVSHVEDLKQRVADRIAVSRLPDGSSTLTVRAG